MTGPTPDPTPIPTPNPTPDPTPQPSPNPTPIPTPMPTPFPTQLPTPGPTATPTTASPTASPTATPTASPTASPTVSPTASPTAAPTASPTASPTDGPTATPTASPTASPTTAPPTATPTTATPTQAPTTGVPTLRPTPAPTPVPQSVRTFEFKTRSYGNTCLEPTELTENMGLRMKACSGEDIQKWVISNDGLISNKKDSKYCITRKASKPDLRTALCTSLDKDLSTFGYNWFDSTIVLLSTREIMSVPVDDSSKQVFLLKRSLNSTPDDKQKWILTAPEGTAVDYVPSTFTIKSTSENKCLKPKKNGSVVLKPCKGKKIERWTSDQYGQVRSEKRNVCLARLKKKLISKSCVSGSDETAFLFDYWDNALARKSVGKLVTITPEGKIRLRKKKADSTKQTWNLVRYEG